MRPLFFFCISFFTLFAFSDPKKLVIVGDSLTEGYGVAKESSYGSLLETKIKDLGKNWVVVSSGISGSTSASAPSRMKWVLKSKPDLIVLALGSNDALRGLKVSETKKHLQQSIEIALKEKVHVVLAGLMAPPNYGAVYTKEFAQIYPSLAKQYQLKLIPFLLQNVAGIQNLNLADGIHPNEKGHVILADNVLATIKDLL